MGHCAAVSTQTCPTHGGRRTRVPLGRPRPDGRDLCQSLGDPNEAAERAEHPPRAMHGDPARREPAVPRALRMTDPVAMVAPRGCRVVPIVVERVGRTLRLYRVSQSGRFVHKCPCLKHLAIRWAMRTFTSCGRPCVEQPRRRN